MKNNIQSLIKVGSTTFLVSSTSQYCWLCKGRDEEIRLDACRNNKHLCRALNLIEQKDDLEAMKQLQLALKDDRNNPFAYDSLAYLYLIHKNYRKSLFAMYRAISILGDCVPAIFFLHLSYICYHIGYYSMWSEYALKALDVDPDNKEAKSEFSKYCDYKDKSLKRAEKINKTKRCKEEAIQLRKEYMLSHDTINLVYEAYCHYVLGNYDRCLKLHEIAEITDPYYKYLAWVVMRKAFAHEMNGDHDKAASIYQSIIDSPFMVDNLQELPLALLLLYGESALYEPVSKFQKDSRSKKSALQRLDDKIIREQRSLNQLSGDVDEMWFCRLKRAAVRCRINLIEGAIDDVRWMLEHDYSKILYLDDCFELLPLRESKDYERLVAEFR